MRIQGIDTGELVSEARKEFKVCLSRVFLEIAQRAFNREPKISPLVMDKGLGCQREYFRTMKGSTNIHEEIVKKAVLQEEERQGRFYSALPELFERLKKAGLTTHTFPPDGKNPSGWDTGLVVGCQIRTESDNMFAFPLIGAKTNNYGTKQPAWEIAYIDDSCVAVREKGNMPELEARKVDVGGAKAEIHDRFLLLDTPDIFTYRELEALRKAYNVSAVVKADSKKGEAILYSGTEDYPLHIALELFH